MSNMKQVGLAHVMYATDYDDRFAPVDWVPSLAPYVKDKDIYRCPKVEKGSGYAYNRLVAGQKIEKTAAPETLVLSFEVDDLHLGAVEDRIAPLNPPRHDDRLTLVYADGQGKVLKFNQLSNLRMDPKSKPPKPPK